MCRSNSCQAPAQTVTPLPPSSSPPTALPPQVKDPSGKPSSKSVMIPWNERESTEPPTHNKGRLVMVTEMAPMVPIKQIEPKAPVGSVIEFSPLPPAATETKPAVNKEFTVEVMPQDTAEKVKADAHKTIIIKDVPRVEEKAKDGVQTTVAVKNAPDVVVEKAKVEVQKTSVVTNTPVAAGPTENLKSFSGQVQSYRKTLRLRYASVDQDDPYGGSVVLEGAIQQLRDGQRVRVHGAIVPPENRNSPATFRVQRVEILD